TGASGVRRWPAIVLAAASIAMFAAPANAQEAANVGALSGTLKKIKDSGTITLGYRESSLPFSYLNRRQQPIGYSIDLCREIVEDVSTELDGMEIKIAFAPVTPANRLQKVASGEIDLECGSTTGNVQRRKEVAFSPIFFVAGTKLMVPKSSSVSSYRDLAGKTAVVTAGTTNEAALRALSDKQKLGITIITAPDHAQSLETLASGKAAAFATDDVLLYGFIATAKNAADMKVVGEYLSYDPYGANGEICGSPADGAARQAGPPPSVTRGRPGHALSSNRNQPLRRQLLRACRHGWLHGVFDNVVADLESHLRPDPGREAVMEAGPDARICNLLGECRQVGPTVGHAWCARACHRDLRNFFAPERRLDNACDAAAQDAMRARVFRVHGRVGNRLPSCLAIRGRVVIDIGIANCRHRPPEIVVVLGIQHGDQCVVGCEGGECHEPRAIDDIHAFGPRQLADEGVISDRPRDEPEAGSLSLLGRSLRALLCAIVLDLIEICRPLVAFQGNRGAWSELRSVVDCERFDLWPHGAAHDRRRHIDARCGPRPVIIGRLRAAFRPGDEDGCRDSLAERDAVRLRRVMGDRDKIVGEGDFPVMRRLCVDRRQHRSRRRCRGRFLRGAGVGRQLHQIRPIAALDRVDCVGHRGMHHPHHPVRAVWCGWPRDAG